MSISLSLITGSPWPWDYRSMTWCTVQGYQDLNKCQWSGDGILSQVMEIQEMGVDDRDRSVQNPEDLMITKYLWWSIPFISCNTLWHNRRERPLTLQFVPPHLLVSTRWHDRGIQVGRNSVHVLTLTCPRQTVVLKHWTLVSWGRMTSLLLSEILDNTKTHSSVTLWTGMVRSVGLTEASCTTEVRLSPLPISSNMSQKWTTSVDHIVSWMLFSSRLCVTDSWGQCGASFLTGGTTFRS